MKGQGGGIPATLGRGWGYPCRGQRQGQRAREQRIPPRRFCVASVSTWGYGSGWSGLWSANPDLQRPRRSRAVAGWSAGPYSPEEPARRDTPHPHPGPRSRARQGLWRRCPAGWGVSLFLLSLLEVGPAGPPGPAPERRGLGGVRGRVRARTIRTGVEVPWGWSFCHSPLVQDPRLCYTRISRRYGVAKPTAIEVCYVLQSPDLRRLGGDRFALRRRRCCRPRQLTHKHQRSFYVPEREVFVRCHAALRRDL